MSKDEAATALGIGRRQVDNILRRFRDEGVSSVRHGNTGRAPVHKTPSEVVQRIVALAGPGSTCADFGVPQLQETLWEEEGIQVGRSTLDRLLREQGLRKPRSKQRRSHRRRQRSSAEGMLVQIDASPHDWLEDRGPRLVLVGAIDDATSKVLYLQFRMAEDLQGYLLLLAGVAQTHGLPVALYHDRHTILRSPKEATLEEELAGITPQSQFQAVVDRLGVQSIPASSPQAKGRIERLWGTLQDRLVKELRRQGITTLEEANAYLPTFIAKHNARFAVAPDDGQPAWEPLPARFDLDYYIAARESRKVRADLTLSWSGQVFQILRHRHEPVLVGQQVTVHIAATGEICLYHGKRRLRHEILPARPPRLSQPPPPASRAQPAAPDPKKAARRRAWLFAEAGSAGPKQGAPTVSSP